MVIASRTIPVKQGLKRRNYLAKTLWNQAENELAVKAALRRESRKPPRRIINLDSGSLPGSLFT